MTVNNAAQAEKVRVRAVVPVEHDGVKYGPGLPDGDEFEVGMAGLAALVAVNAVEALAAGEVDSARSSKAKKGA